jgi:predicted acetyltransferase
MAIEVIPATPEDKALLSNLIELYLYDLSELMKYDAGSDGRFSSTIPLLDQSEESGSQSFLIIASGKPAGFVIVENNSGDSGKTAVHSITEFFVLRKYRRRGVGICAAFQVFDRLPGEWQIRQLGNNTQAIAFWRRVIGEYTAGGFSELIVNDYGFHSVAQRFDTSDRAGPARRFPGLCTPASGKRCGGLRAIRR